MHYDILPTQAYYGRVCYNTLPTITAVAVTRQKGSPAANSQIATVMDAEDAENNLGVTIDGGRRRQQTA